MVLAGASVSGGGEATAVVVAEGVGADGEGAMEATRGEGMEVPAGTEWAFPSKVVG